MYIAALPVLAGVITVPSEMPSSSGVLLNPPLPVISSISMLFMLAHAIEPESSRMNRMFGATRFAVVSGSSGMVMPACTGTANSVARQAAGKTQRGLLAFTERERRLFMAEAFMGVTAGITARVTASGSDR